MTRWSISEVGTVDQGDDMSIGSAIATAATFFWLGTVVAISFIEAPLKFRAPGVTLQIGLGIGRLVFRAVNRLEAVLAAALVIGLLVTRPGVTSVIAAAVAVVALGCQLIVVRPRLALRSDLVLSGTDAPRQPSPRSRAHHAYIALEVAKVAALAVAGIALLAG